MEQLLSLLFRDTVLSPWSAPSSTGLLCTKADLGPVTSLGLSRLFPSFGQETVTGSDMLAIESDSTSLLLLDWFILTKWYTTLDRNIFALAYTL